MTNRADGLDTDALVLLVQALQAHVRDLKSKHQAWPEAHPIGTAPYEEILVCGEAPWHIVTPPNASGYKELPEHMLAWWRKQLVNFGNTHWVALPPRVKTKAALIAERIAEADSVPASPPWVERFRAMSKALEHIASSTNPLAPWWVYVAAMQGLGIALTKEDEDKRKRDTRHSTCSCRGSV